jgi:hypothetical protein
MLLSFQNGDKVMGTANVILFDVNQNGVTY